MSSAVLVLAKAPVAGLVKTRLAVGVGNAVAADLAAAALLDTLDVVSRWAPAERRLLALDGDLGAAVRAPEIARALRGWEVVVQRGPTFAARLVAAHREASALCSDCEAIIQIGSDTPTLTAGDLEALRAAVAPSTAASADAALGPATDGGWWGLARAPELSVDCLARVAMSRSDTAAHTRSALQSTGARVIDVHELSDVDTVEDALAAAWTAPHTRFAVAFRANFTAVAGL